MKKKNIHEMSSDECLEMIQELFEKYHPSIGEIHHPDFVNEELRLSFIWQLAEDPMVKRAEICFLKDDLSEVVLNPESPESPNYVVYRTDMAENEPPVIGEDGSLEEPLPPVRDFYACWLNYGKPIIQMVAALDEKDEKRLTITDGRIFYTNEKEEDRYEQHEIVDRYGFLVSIHFNNEEMEKDFYGKADEIIHRLIMS